MTLRLLARRWSTLTARELTALSACGLDPCEHDAELWLGEFAEPAVVLGAFQRATQPEPRRARRLSGGPTLAVGPGSIYLALRLAHPGALTPCDAPRAVNRYVRPLLRALTKVGCTAHYFGRDWVSVVHRPAAWIGFAHDATVGRLLVEAVIAVTTPFALQPSAAFLGKEPGTLAAITGVSLGVHDVAAVLGPAYAAAYGRELVVRDEAPPAPAADIGLDPPWSACAAEAIGDVAAGRDRDGRLRVGGDFMASRDAVAAIEGRLAAVPPSADREDIAELVEGAFSAPGVVLQGVRSLESLVDVIVRARAADMGPSAE